VLAMFMASVWQSLALQHYIALCFASGAHAKALVQHSLFRRLIELPQTTIQDVTAGLCYCGGRVPAHVPVQRHWPVQRAQGSGGRVQG
jgi:hypothetical protein